MSLINNMYLLIKGSVCFRCKHQDICKFVNSIGMEANITTGCSDKNDKICHNKK